MTNHQIFSVNSQQWTFLYDLDVLRYNRNSRIEMVEWPSFQMPMVYVTEYLLISFTVDRYKVVSQVNLDLRGSFCAVWKIHPVFQCSALCSTRINVKSIEEFLLVTSCLLHDLTHRSLLIHRSQASVSANEQSPAAHVRDCVSCFEQHEFYELHSQAISTRCSFLTLNALDRESQEWLKVHDCTLLSLPCAILMTLRTQIRRF